jgi:hypothetical protein
MTPIERLKLSRHPRVAELANTVGITDKKLFEYIKSIATSAEAIESIFDYSISSYMYITQVGSTLYMNTKYYNRSVTLERVLWLLFTKETPDIHSLMRIESQDYGPEWLHEARFKELYRKYLKDSEEIKRITKSSYKLFDPERYDKTLMQSYGKRLTEEHDRCKYNALNELFETFRETNYETLP